jgi:ABC-type polysaccharide/polyol phosphate transport system ATPase subunit
MNNKTVIEVNNLFKRFLIGTTEKLTMFQTLRYKLSGLSPLKELWALKNINLKINEGEMVAIIGPNGSGKTTLLKIIAGIIRPTFGTIKVNGEISTIFELGLGFNPRFNAIENIYLYGALHGLSRQEVKKKLDAILDFAELKDFAGTKLADFSSGMRVRLAFATIIQTVKEIILVDEVLSVGDTAFQKKCITILFLDIGKFTSLSEELGAEKTFLLLQEILQLICPTIYKNKGFVDKFIGDAILALFSNESSFAIQSAIKIIQDIKLNFPNIEIGIGIHKGEVILGTLGLEERMETTVIGDAVNVASRIQNQTKELGYSLLVSDDCLTKEIRNQFGFKKLGEISLRGKKERVLLSL